MELKEALELGSCQALPSGSFVQSHLLDSNRVDSEVSATGSDDEEAEELQKTKKVKIINA